jgi:hypothetical protein
MMVILENASYRFVFDPALLEAGFYLPDQL